jgi:predicted nucleotidyltransferase
MTIINETIAWEIIEKYSNECIQLDPESLVAVYVIGSLSDGYYRPGESDIDAVLLVTDDSEKIWGNKEKPSQKLADLNQRYLQDYGIPKDFGPFPIQLRELHPPYDHDKELTLEIARLKLQGKAVYGTYLLDKVPMPSKEDFLTDFKHFEEWWDSEFSKNHPIEYFSARACVNTVLLHLNRFLITEKDIIQFNKMKIIPLCISYAAPFLDQQVNDTIERCLLKSSNITEGEINNLRQYVSYLRDRMNTLLQIRH